MSSRAVRIGLLLLVVFDVLVVRWALGHGTDLSGEDSTDGSSATSFEAPAALPRVGSLAQIKVLADGDLLVSQWVRTRQGLTAVDLGPPARDASLPDVRASRIRVAADGDAVSGAQTVTDTGARYDFKTAARLINVTYRLSGTAERSPGVAGRALIQATSLPVSYAPREGPARVVISGLRIRSIACVARARTAQPEPCGGPTANGWRLDLRGSDRLDRVIAQVDLEN